MKSCPICGKTSQMGGKRNLLRGKYNPTPRKRKYPNLQWVRVPVPNRNEKGAPKGAPWGFSEKNYTRVKICTRCLKKGLHTTAKLTR